MAAKDSGIPTKRSIGGKACERHCVTEDIPMDRLYNWSRILVVEEQSEGKRPEF